jgi:hypothetical protein
MEGMGAGVEGGKNGDKKGVASHLRRSDFVIAKIPRCKI